RLAEATTITSKTPTATSTLNPMAAAHLHPAATGLGTGLSGITAEGTRLLLNAPDVARLPGGTGVRTTTPEDEAANTTTMGTTERIVARRPKEAAIPAMIIAVAHDRAGVITIRE